MRYPSYMRKDFTGPDFFRVKMDFPDERVGDVEGEIRRRFREIGGGVKPGQTVAVGLGSRGIHGVDVMARALCRAISETGAVPFIVPAMGSHGGATPEGQEKILADLNITPDTCGARVEPSMSVERIGTVFDDIPVFFSKKALKAHHIVCLNRIKPHSKFKAPVESGIVKMLCVGLGKHQGAAEYHRGALKHGFYPLLKEMGKTILARTPFLGGIAVVENAHDRTMIIKAAGPGDLFEKEAALLLEARRHFPRLPFSRLDALIIQRAGKDISGAGMDPNVTGRAYDLMESDFSENLKATRVAVLDLTDKTAGNAIGVGNADIITEKVFEKMDHEKTLINALSSLSLRKAFIPVRMPSDRMAVQACFSTIGPVPEKQVRAVIIKDTLRVGEFLAAEALEAEIQKNPLARIQARGRLMFNERGGFKGLSER